MNEQGPFELAVEILINRHLVNEMGSLCSERRQRCNVDVRIMANDRQLPMQKLTFGTEGDVAIADARIALRKGSKPTSIRFQYKVMVRGLAPGTGFSGIESEGRIDLADPVSPIKVQGVVHGYNRWTFPAELDFKILEGE